MENYFIEDIHGNKVEVQVIPAFESYADKLCQERGYLCKEHYKDWAWSNGFEVTFF